MLKICYGTLHMILISHGIHQIVQYEENPNFHIDVQNNLKNNKFEIYWETGV